MSIFSSVVDSVGSSVKNAVKNLDTLPGIGPVFKNVSGLTGLRGGKSALGSFVQSAQVAIAIKGATGIAKPPVAALPMPGIPGLQGGAPLTNGSIASESVLDKFSSAIKGILSQPLGDTTVGKIVGAPTNGGNAGIPDVLNKAFDTYQRLTQILTGSKAPVGATDQSVTTALATQKSGPSWLLYAALALVGGFILFKVVKR